MGEADTGGENTIETARGRFAVVRAEPAHAEAVLGILREAARWQLARGVDQWRPEQFQLEPLLAAIAHREVYLALRDGEPAATVTLQWEDRRFWGERPPDAGYVHRIAVRRAYAGQELGLALLHWAERKASAAGKSYLRLDCMTENAALRAYYERAGYEHRGEVSGTLSSGKPWSASLYEKRLAPSAAQPQTARLVVAPADAGDVDTLVAIEEDATRWVRSQGFDPGEPPFPLREIYARRAARGEVYLARLDGEPAAMVTLKWEDPAVWGDAAGAQGDAVYVHGLMVRRAFAGQGIGLALLRWAEDIAMQAGRRYVRLDCMANNAALRAYYAGVGFSHHGDVTLETRTASRYEKRVEEQ